MKVTPDRSMRIFGAAVLMQYLCAMEQEIEGVRKAKDIEPIHRMRVASRRFRATLPLFRRSFAGSSTKTWQAEIRKLARALGDARDVDVQIDRLAQVYTTLEENRLRPGIRRLLTRLKQQRLLLQTEVKAAVDAFETSGILVDIYRGLSQWAAQAVQPYPYSRSLYALAYAAIHTRLEELLSYQIYLTQPERIEELHAMRVAAKRLRYLLEAFEPLYPNRMKSVIQTVKSTQDLLGLIHDADVWMAFLPGFIEEERTRTPGLNDKPRPMGRLLPGLRYLQELHLAERESLYCQFVQEWHGWTNEEMVWEKLEAMIKLPVSMEGEVFPPAERTAGWTS